MRSSGGGGAGEVVLETGGRVDNVAGQREVVAPGEPDGRRHAMVVHLDLQREGLVAFDDPYASIDQMDLADRLSNARSLRLTAVGRDRVGRLRKATAAPSGGVTQIVFAHQAQVAARDINNDFRTYDELLDRIAEALAHMPDLTEEDREEAVTLLSRLRGKADTVVTSAAGGAGGAVVGALLKQLLGLP